MFRTAQGKEKGTTLREKSISVFSRSTVSQLIRAIAAVMIVGAVSAPTPVRAALPADNPNRTDPPTQPSPMTWCSAKTSRQAT